MYLVVGLGNPGSKYARTRHNVGFDVVELLADRLGTRITKLKCKALYAEAKVGSERVVIAQPQTFMNLSGQSVVELMNWFKVPVGNLIVCYDDIDLELGALRVRAKGSAGTHNGMRSIVYLLGSDQFPRVRVGIGKPAPGWDLADHVLAGYHTPAERELAFDGYQDAVDAVIDLIKNGVESATKLASERTALRYPKESKPKKDKNGNNKLTFSEVGHHAWDLIRAGKLSGAACCITMDSKNAYQGMFGLANVESGEKLKKDSLFRLGELTHPIIASAAMMMVERGQLDLGASVISLFPELAADPTIDQSFTVRDLLTGSSPLPADRAYALVQRAVEAQANLDLPTFAKLMIFEPLKMKNTAWTADAARVAPLYTLENGVLTERVIDQYDGAYGTLSDYSRFVQMLLGEGELDGVRILEAQSVQQMKTVTSSDKNAAWGLGVHVHTEQNAEQPLSVGSFSLSGAYGLHFWVDPKKKLTAVYMSSLCDAEQNAQTFRQFERDVYDVLNKQ